MKSLRLCIGDRCGLLCMILIYLTTFANCDIGKGNPDKVEVLIWSGGSWSGFTSGDFFRAPNYLGHDVDKREWNCPVDCRYTGDKRRLGNADAVIFEAQPLTSYYDEYKRGPPQWAQKYFDQFWVNFGYETHVYFNIYGDKGYMDYIDINMTFYQHSQVPITFHCFWGGGSMEDFLKPAPPKSRDKCVAFMATNCGSGGATYRTAYVKELMEYFHIDSLGKCLHNTDLPKEMQFPIYSDHGASMRNKVEIFKQYKFVLCFENNNITDYVTEKMPNVLQAGTVPIYMGSPNVHPDWTPGEHSILRTDDFKGPRDLANYLEKVCNDDEEYAKFFEWKKKGVSPQFKEKVDNCVFYGAECRLCQYIVEQRKKLSAKQLEEVKKRKEKYHQYFSLVLSGGQHVEVPSSPKLNLQQEFSLSAWIKLNKFDVPIIDRQAFSLSVRMVWKRGYLELCIPGKCYLGTHPIVLDSWYHVVAVFKYDEGADGHVKFFVNGIEDPTEETPDSFPQESDYAKNPPLLIGSNSDKSSFFSGQIDDISVWNIAISTEQGKRLVFDIPTGIENGLVAYFGLNHDKGAVLDSTGNHEGKTQGEPQWVESITKPLVTVNPCL